MQIRKFRKADARNVSDLIKKCLLEVNNKDYSKKIIDFICKHHVSKKLILYSIERSVFVAEEKGKILGTASLKDNVIKTVFVNPKFHGKGIGSKLMNTVETLAKKRGCKTVVGPSSITAYEFYKQRGYKKVKVVYSSEYGKIIRMRKKL